MMESVVLMFLRQRFAWYARYRVRRGLPSWQYVRIGISNCLSFSSWRRRRVSSRDGLVPFVKAVLGLGMAGADGMGDFSLKTSGVGREGRGGGSV